MFNFALQSHKTNLFSHQFLLQVRTSEIDIPRGESCVQSRALMVCPVRLQKYLVTRESQILYEHEAVESCN